MKKILRNFIILFLALFIVAIPTLAEGAEISKTAHANSNGYEWDITFSLPSKQAVITPVADVVIILDKSTLGGSTTNLKLATQKFIDDLWAKSQNDGITFRVGVIWFNADVHTYANDLVELNATNYLEIKDFLDSYAGSGTNFHGAIMQGKKWLDADTTTPNKNKFMIVLSDFAGNLLDAGDGIGLARYAIRDASVTRPDTQPVGSPIYESNAECFDKQLWGQYPLLSDLEGPTPNFVYTIAMIDDLISGQKLLTGVAPRDLSLLTTVGSSVGEYSLTANGGTGTTLTADQIAALPSQVENREIDVPTIFEKSIYLTGNLFLEMKASDYSVMAITQDYNNLNTVLGYQNKAYVQWFKQNIGDQYDITGGVPDDVANGIFAHITSVIFDIVGKGTITDVIADEFEYINNRFSVEVNGAILPVTTISEYEHGFGELLASGLYEYQLKYDPSTRTVTWDINVSASRYQQLELTFKIKYKDDICKIGSPMNLKTNKSAILDYVDSIDAEAGLPYNKHITMDSPVVSVSNKIDFCKRHEPPKTGVTPNMSPWLFLTFLGLLSLSCAYEMMKKSKK